VTTFYAQSSLLLQLRFGSTISVMHDNLQNRLGCNSNTRREACFSRHRVSKRMCMLVSEASRILRASAYRHQTPESIVHAQTCKNLRPGLYHPLHSCCLRIAVRAIVGTRPRKSPKKNRLGFSSVAVQVCDTLLWIGWCCADTEHFAFLPVCASRLRSGKRVWMT
jgi:hypothetical protein